MRLPPEDSAKKVRSHGFFGNFRGIMLPRALWAAGGVVALAAIGGLVFYHPDASTPLQLQDDESTVSAEAEQEPSQIAQSTLLTEEKPLDAEGDLDTHNPAPSSTHALGVTFSCDEAARQSALSDYDKKIQAENQKHQNELDSIRRLVANLLGHLTGSSSASDEDSRHVIELDKIEREYQKALESLKCQ